jgi:hypothetical protein
MLINVLASRYKRLQVSGVKMLGKNNRSYVNILDEQ